MVRVEVGVEDVHHLARLARPQVVLGALEAPPDRQEELSLEVAVAPVALAGLQGDCSTRLCASFGY